VAKRLALVLTLLFLLPAVATAATVKVRVEGKTRTLFGPTEVTVSATTALDALEQASLAGEFYYHITTTSFGPYVDQIGRYGASASSGWVFKVDDKSPPVGADQVQLADGDHVLWYYADFGPAGGPPTLSLKATSRGCYSVHAFDDNGGTATVTGLQVHIGSKRTVNAAPDKTVCPGPHPGLLVRATATGAIRSNALK
jgi:hypothetical protein